MTLTKEKLQEMVDTFTVSYYLGHKIEVIDVNETANAYTSGNSDIHIGLGIINRALANIDENISKEELRRIVRGVFYHELGHILLTPIKYMNIVESGLNNYFKQRFLEIAQNFADTH